MPLVPDAITAVASAVAQAAMVGPKVPDDVDQSGLIQICTVHDVFAHTGTYAVRKADGSSAQAMRLSNGSGTPMGAREITELTIGDSVICAFLPGVDYGQILGTSVCPQLDGRFVLPDSLVMRSLVGFFQDQFHYSPYENTENKLMNFSGGRPADTLPGDWGYINELGVAIWLGKLMVQMRASDSAKIEAFWGDDLVRIFGYNLDTMTAAKSHRSFDDEGEYCEVELWTPFMWESYGALEPGTTVLEENDGDSGGLKQDQEKSRFEPTEELQTMAFRGQKLKGFLGDGEREVITLLPTETGGVLVRDDARDGFRGVLEIHKSLSGSYHVRSAKEIILEKSLILPVPTQLLDPDDPSGDTAAGDDANYKSAGYYGSGPDQEKKPFEWPDDSEYAGQRSTLLWEYEEYLFGKFMLQVIDSHEKDWEAPEAEDLIISEGGESNEIDKALFENMAFDAGKKLPQYGEAKIDQRQGHDVRYYQARSCFHMLDDGSVVIEDGYGSQIVMSEGHITVTCQGDVMTRPGRSAITMAPRDIINRAGWCAEMTAAKADVRIKAENNMHLLAGDGEKGSILLECRAEGEPSKSDWTGKYGEDIESKGIILKADDNAINLWSKKLFGGYTKEEVGIVEFSSGAGSTIIDGADVGIEATANFGVLVGTDRSETGNPGQLTLDQGKMRVNAELDVLGNFGVWAGTFGSGNIDCEGHVYCEQDIGAISSIFCLGQMSANGMNSTVEHNGTGGGRAPNVDNRKGETQSDLETGRNLYIDFETDTLDDSDVGAANREVWDEIGFSFRKSVEHYKIADDFKLNEARWQQLYRVFGSIDESWDEPIVEAPDGTETQPWPGKKAWEDDKHYAYTESGDSDNIDYNTSMPKKREDQTEVSAPMTEAVLKEEYVITVQTT